MWNQLIPNIHTKGFHSKSFYRTFTCIIQISIQFSREREREREIKFLSELYFIMREKKTNIFKLNLIILIKNSHKVLFLFNNNNTKDIKLTSK